MRAAYITLGCKVNQYDTQAMEEILQADGFETVEFGQVADVYLINTCTVTATADKKSRQMISRARECNPGAVICVCGCLAQRQAEKVLEMEGVSAVIGAKNRAMIGEIVRRALEGEEKICAVEEIARERKYEPLHIAASPERTRANVKICEGCENYCSYCIIPYARGPVRSRGMEDVAREAKVLAKSGVKEIVLTGIHIGSYGKDLAGASLIGLIERLQTVEGIERIRLGSLEPSLLTEEFCRRAARIGKLCPHFHVSLQSGSEGVLKRMNRKYTAREYAQYIANVRRYFENPAITTDVIAGFQGESEQEHEQTLAFLAEIGFAKIHVFPFSKREGTAAARMKGDVPAKVKKRRAHEIGALADRMAAEYQDAFLGKVEKVLLEQQEKEGFCTGHNERYVCIQAKGKPGEMVDVLVEERQDGILLGRTLESPGR